MVPFGFSVGDFIAGINLLIDAVNSLSDTNGAQADYEELGRQLKNLRKGFECIQGLSLDSTQSAQVSAVDTAINDCRLCVDGFVKRNSKFKSLEATSGTLWSLAALKRQGRKVQWALWKKADVAKFRAAIQQHSDALQMLLASIQIKQTETQGKLLASAEQRNVEHNSLTQEVYGKVSDLSIQQQRLETQLGDGKTSLMQALEVQFNRIRDEVQTRERSRETLLVAQVFTEVESINSQIGALKSLENSVAGDAYAFKEYLPTIIENQQQIIAQLRNMSVTARVNQEIPAQILFSKPVVLLDARGQYAAFFLEFIQSAKAFIDVLKDRFKDVGLHKIEAGEFALEDSRLKRSLQLTKPWAAIVRPGQQINMSMVFRLKETPTARCPGCYKENAGSDLEDIECGNSLCGVIYRRIVEENAASSTQSKDSRNANSGHIQSSNPEPQLKRPNHPENSTNDEMQHYTRLHILTQARVTAVEADSFRRFAMFEKNRLVDANVKTEVLDSFRNFAMYEKDRLDRRKGVSHGKPIKLNERLRLHDRLFNEFQFLQQQEHELRLILQAQMEFEAQVAQATHTSRTGSSISSQAVRPEEVLGKF